MTEKITRFDPPTGGDGYICAYCGEFVPVGAIHVHAGLIPRGGMLSHEQGQHIIEQGRQILSLLENIEYLLRRK